MACCTCDNPKTMARECWQDGRLLCKYDASLLLSRPPIPREYLFFGANTGPWKEGQLCGDPAAMKPGGGSSTPWPNCRGYSTIINEPGYWWS